MPPRTRTTPPADAEATPADVAPAPDYLANAPAFLHRDDLPGALREGDLTVLPAPADMAALGLVRVMPRAEHAARLSRLVAPFPASQIEHLPKTLRRDDRDYGPCADRRVDDKDCGGRHPLAIHLDYIGHAGITARLLEVDPLWTLEPVEVSGGTPVARPDGSWWRLTVLGMTRLAYGDASGKSGPNAIKEVLGDAIRNGAMRFGVGTYLWSKSEDAQVLRAGGQVDDPPPPPPRRAPAPPRQERRATAERQAAAAPPAEPAELDPEQAIAYRQNVLDAADRLPIGPERDEALKAIRDEAQRDRGLGNLVATPEPWRRPGGAATCTLLQLILAARTVTIPSSEGPPAADPCTPADEHDPWATEPPQEA